jgi:hypothetical protein
MLGLTDAETHNLGNILTILGMASPFVPKAWKFIKTVIIDIKKFRK